MNFGTGFVRPALAGAAATVAGIGLARFAYVPLFPAMVTAGWVDPTGAGLIGAANLTGYLAGALGGRSLARRIGTARALDAGMALACLTFAACAWNGGWIYLALWRAVAGVAGGVLMGLAGPSVQSVVPASRRGQAGGIVVSGVGGGAVLSAIAAPYLVSVGIAQAWLTMAAAVAVLWTLAHHAWPDATIAPSTQGQRVNGTARLLTTYALSGAGMVAHMVYLADLAVRGRGMSPAAGAIVWIAFGIGAVCGTLLGGRMSDRWGARKALWVWLSIQVVAVLAVLLETGWTLGIAGLLGGFAGVGISAVALARAREVAAAQSSALWAKATAAYAAAQAAMAFALAGLFSRTGSHAVLFEVCLVLSVAGWVLATLDWRSGARIT